VGPFLLALAVLLLAGWASGMIASSRYDGRTPDEFIAWLAPHARAGNRRTGIPASVVIAQAALESAWGDSRLAREAANLFGIKAGRSWRGRVISAPTREYIDGEWITLPGAWRVFPNSDAAVAAGLPASSLFRYYSSPLESVEDHARVIYNGLYAAALANRSEPEAFANALTGVYATDPHYGTKLITTMRARDLTRFDVPPAEWALDPGLVPPEWIA